jgi:hypothetical protein
VNLWYKHSMFSKFVRRTHMYLALFLTPWMLGYGLSTIVMNHNMTGPQTFVKEREQPYSIAADPAMPPRQIAEYILADLHLNGAFGVQGPQPDGTLVINRQDLISPRRITYNPTAKTVVVERVLPTSSQLLNRFHHRRGYQQPYAADQAMAWSIDLVVVSMVFWALSGLWMWWEMRATRWWGVAATAFGFGMFALLALTI